MYAGFLGFTPASGIVQQSFGQSVQRMGDMMENGVESLLSLPGKIPALWERPSATPRVSRTPRWAWSARPVSAARCSPWTSRRPSRSP